MGNLGGDHPRRLHGDPGAGASTRRRRCEAVADERCTSLYGVPTMFIAELGLADFAEYDLSSLRTGIMAGSPCPVEVMKRVVDRDAHDRGGDLLRHDRDLAGVDADPRRRRPGPPHRDGRPGACRTWRPRSSTRRPA